MILGIRNYDRELRSAWTARFSLACRTLTSSIFVLLLSALAFSQTVVEPVRTGSFRIGERLSYSVSFENLKDIAFFETHVVSQGKLSGKDVIEMRGRLKTFDLISAAFSIVDERRTVFVDPESGLPLFIDRTQNEGAVPLETVSNYLTAPTTNLDLLSFIFKLREAGGNGSFSIFEDGETSIITAQTARGEKVKTDAGEFETSLSTLTGTYLDAHGFKKLTVNLSSDNDRLPVLIRIRTATGEYRAELSSIHVEKPEPVVDPTPTPVPTPKPISTPKPQTTPTPYVDNVPLLPELSFALGESLQYKVANSGTPVAILTLTAAERKLINNQDSLKLSATITGIEQGNKTFALGDSAVVLVNPDTLAPFQSVMKFGGALSSLNQTASFDPKTGSITFGAANAVDAPIGTHTILSLIYAMRSFNLRPSKDPGNPVNDTRVAVLWNDRPYIFTLRPANTETITFDGEKVSAQLITINTGNPQLDQLALKVWLSADGRRVPLRFSVGTFQADLVSISKNLPK